MMTAEQEAKFDLAVMNYAAEGIYRDLVAVEAAKALALAWAHAGIEARILCRNADEVKRALEIIYSVKTWQHENARWNSAEGGLEYSNGSLVVVVLDGKRQVPK